jgi:hypothetical protein
MQELSRHYRFVQTDCIGDAKQDFTTLLNELMTTWKITLLSTIQQPFSSLQAIDGTVRTGKLI